ncbi:hypothetical protein ACC771_16725, partial [Rhizobium ruizarguesonis]
MLKHQCRYLIVAKGEFTNGGLFIKRRKAAKAHDISGENGCKLSIHSGHRSIWWLSMRTHCTASTLHLTMLKFHLETLNGANNSGR